MKTIEERLSAVESVLFQLNQESESINKVKVNIFNSRIPIIQRIKTFEDACLYLKLNAVNLTGTVDEIAYKKLKIIINALNEGWTPNWNNTNENKFFPYFSIEKYDGKNGNCKGAGLGYCLTAYGAGLTFTFFGSRLCFKTRELAKYAGNQFNAIYSDYLL